MTASAMTLAEGGRRSDWLTPTTFLLPACVLYLVFSFLPTLSVVRFSFTDWDGISPVKTWVGLRNYIQLFFDPIFLEAFWNTCWWAAIIVVINVGLGLILATLLSRVARGRALLQTAITVPIVLAPVTVAVIWRWMYQPYGVINEVLRDLGFSFLAHPWLGVPSLVLPALAIAHCWSSIGLSVMIFMAGLQAVDEDLYDAARIDGANRYQLFRYVTLPALKPITAVVFILTLTHAFKSFDLIWSTTQGGPIRSSEILATYMYKRGALQNEYGYGSAISVALLVIVTLITAIYLNFQERRER
ncbi:sugar ABC transporter permease [Mesorhizobium sp. VK25A]|uniref:Sugar ABC transporter permease n=1 Tax=Mesorhizobium vachelliae TaxID=3072309 RepID=A0ABU5ABP7_9HYPH|nr:MULTISPECIES: sugar ABC transporter permease [unclassified Mesorhizobium]MDX8535148.1 sugar ABC transporter permease [Mesorhizobium sp. VK25D]MDX8547924.1 sugar ABC transporter permease [Mesorhizobium sp. VK25A]